MLSPHVGGEAGGGLVVNDLFCGEALSPNTRCANPPSDGRPHDEYSNAATATKRCPMSPSRTSLGSSFPSKIGENSPRFVHQHNPFRSDHIAVTIARKGPTVRRNLVADLDDSRPAIVELGEAMRMLQERAATTPYKLTDRYVATLTSSGVAATRSGTTLRTVRRDSVFLVFKLVEAYGLRKLVAAHAIAYLDRFLDSLITSSSLGNSPVGDTSQCQYIAAACVLIAAKMDDTAAPSIASLSRLFSAGKGKMSERRLRDMEADVLQVLGWKLMGVTTSDFVEYMLAQLLLYGVSSSLVQTARWRADELIHATLTEVEFLDFEQSVISLSVMQCILDETLPIQGDPHMAVLRTILVVDKLIAQQCYKTLVDLVVNQSRETLATAPDS